MLQCSCHPTWPAYGIKELHLDHHRSSQRQTYLSRQVALLLLKKAQAGLQHRQAWKLLPILLTPCQMKPCCQQLLLPCLRPLMSSARPASPPTRPLTPRQASPAHLLPLLNLKASHHLLVGKTSLQPQQVSVPEVAEVQLEERITQLFSA